MASGGVVMILYADVLFIIDFSMDVISLWITAQITLTRLTVARASVTAAVSALISVVVTALGTSRAVSALITIALSVLMSLTAFKVASFSVMLKRFVILWLSGVLLGGVMTYLMSIGNAEKYSFAFDRHGGTIGLVPIALLLIFILVRTLCTAKNVKNADLTLSFGGKKVSMTALCDSGNLLSDPFTGETVVFVRADKVKTLFNEEEFGYLASNAPIIPDSLIKLVRVIPAKTVSGESLIRALRLNVSVNGKKDCLAVVSLTHSLEDGAPDAVISLRLM